MEILVKLGGIMNKDPNLKTEGSDSLEWFTIWEFPLCTHI